MRSGINLRIAPCIFIGILLLLENIALFPACQIISAHTIMQLGRVEDVVGDCCGYCPKPETEEELEVAEAETKIYVSGEISFLKDDPGRQARKLPILPSTLPHLTLRCRILVPSTR